MTKRYDPMVLISPLRFRGSQDYVLRSPNVERKKYQLPKEALLADYPAKLGEFRLGYHNERLVKN